MSQCVQAALETRWHDEEDKADEADKGDKDKRRLGKNGNEKSNKEKS